jgi:exosortase
MSIQVASAPSAPPEVAVPARLRPPVLLAAALGLACLPLLWLHAQMLWEKPHYQFFPWALLGAGVLAWQRREMMRPLQPGLPAISYTLLGAAWLLLAAAGYVVSPWLGMVAALLTLTGFVWLLGGYRLFLALFPSLVLLLVLVPPPLGLDTRLILLMQTSTTNLASRTLDWLDVPHVPFAHTLQVASGPLLVDEACSGIASLFSVVTFTLFFCFFVRRGLVHTLALLVFAVTFVALGNVARVALITLLKAQHNIDLVSGWRHEMTGLVVFALCLALTASMDQVILFFTEVVRLRSAGGLPAPSSAGGPPALRKARGLIAPLSLPSAAYCGAAFAVVGLLSLYNVWIHPHALRGDPSAQALDAASIQPKMSADALPEHIGPWERVSYKRETRSSSDPVGHYSDIWRYRQEKKGAIDVAIDYPFRGGHDLTVCYVAKGWHESAAAFPLLKGDAADAPTTVMVDMERSTIEKGYLWFSALDERGRWLPADALHRTSGMNRFVDRFATEAATTVQVQLFLVTPAALDDAGRAEVRELFGQLRTQIRDRLFAAAKEQP